jgi:tetratricopeptide (TPR) repeat protein
MRVRYDELRRQGSERSLEETRVIDFLDSAAVTVHSFPDDDPTARAAVLFALGRAYLGTGFPMRAAPFLEEALEIQEREPGTDPLEMARSLEAMSILRRYQSRTAESRELILRALRIRRDLDAEGEGETIGALVGIAALPGDPTDRVARYRRAFGLAEENDDAEAMVETLNHLGKLYIDLHEPMMALVCLDAARDLCFERLGPQSLHLAGNHLFRSLILKRRGDLVEAERVLREALAIQTARLGPTGIEQVHTMDLLAQILSRNQRHGEAACMMEEAIGQRIAIQGHDHVTVATSLHNLARIRERQGDDAAAARAYLEAARLDAAHGFDDPFLAYYLVRNTAMLYFRAGDVDRALELGRLGLALGSDIADPTHLSNLGRFYQAPGRLEEAAFYFEEAVAARRGSRDKEALARALARSAIVLGALGEHARAETCMAEALTLVPEGHPNRIDLELDRVDFLIGAGRSGEAGRLLDQLVPDAGHRRGRVAMARGRLLAASGKHEAAESELEEAVGLCRQTGGDSLALAACRGRLIEVCRALGLAVMAAELEASAATIDPGLCETLLEVYGGTHTRDRTRVSVP